MFATGMMDPNWWKFSALDHRWYRDDNAYADYSGQQVLGAGIGVHFDGARGFSYVSFPNANGAVSFSPTDEPFEVNVTDAFELKDPDGAAKYRVTKLVCDKNTLTFTMLNLSTNKEIPVVMEIAPEGFTTDLFDPSSTQQDVAADQVETAPPAQPWICPCGASNVGKYCTQCGHKYRV